MTYEEALKIIEECGLNVSTAKHDECMGKIKEAVEKQIPKKPQKFCGIWICPTCDYGQDTSRIKPSYCKSCGQHLDWSE